MPYKSRKVRNKNCYKVYKNDKTKKVFAKCATKENAKKQMRLLRAIQFNKNFKPNARRNMGGKSRKNKTLKKKGGRGSNTSDGAQFAPLLPPRIPGPPLRSGDYIQITAGQYVNIIVTSSIRANNSVGFQHHRLLSAITGVITSELGPPFTGYYHMIVTTGNSQIQAGTSLYISMQDYDADSHPPLIINPDSEPEEKRDDEPETQLIVR